MLLHMLLSQGLKRMNEKQSMLWSLELQGWALPDLDTLPLGVALPLREALQRCRAQPPAGSLPPPPPLPPACPKLPHPVSLSCIPTCSCAGMYRRAFVIIFRVSRLHPTLNVTCHVCLL